MLLIGRKDILMGITSGKAERIAVAIFLFIISGITANVRSGMVLLTKS